MVMYVDHLFLITFDEHLILMITLFAPLHPIKKLWVMVMVFNTTFNNVSVISWRSVLLIEETGVARENHQPAASH